VSERPVPQIGDVSLEAVLELEHELDAGFSALAVAGLPGEVQQRAARRSHRMRVRGVAIGPEAADQLSKLQLAAAGGEELTFAADITSALELQRVVVTGFRAVEEAGRPNHYAYELELAESPPLPEPAVVDGFGFGGLDEFGLGDLGFDTDLLGDLQDLAGDVAGAIDSALDAIDQIAALANIGSLGNLDGLMSPIGGVVDGVGSAAGSLRDSLDALGKAFS
jgi:hypothetical protein